MWHPFTGLKPAGLDVGPVNAAAHALESGSVDGLVEVLCDENERWRSVR